MSTVVVTGGAGFIGRALCPALRSAGHRVVVTTRDAGRSPHGDGIAVRTSPELGSESDWSAAFADADAVVHLAARAHVMIDRAADPAAEYRRVNAEGTQRLAEAAARAGARRFVFLSTAKVNGEDSSAAPFRETDPPMPLDAYARSKLAAERALTGVRAETGLETVVLRPPLVYGREVRGNFLALLKLCQRALPCRWRELPTGEACFTSATLPTRSFAVSTSLGRQGRCSCSATARMSRHPNSSAA